MRVSIRLLGAAAVATAMLAGGSPAFAGSGHDEGGHGGDGANVNLVCGIGVGVIGSADGNACGAGNGGWEDD